MTTYRTGNVAGFPPPAVWAGDAIVAVVVNGDQALAERICALLNGGEQPEAASDVTTTPYRIYSRWWHAGDRSNRAVWSAIQDAYALGLASDAPSAPAISPQAAQNGPAVPTVTPDAHSGPEASQLRAVGLCPQRADHHLMESCGSCPYTQLAHPAEPAWHHGCTGCWHTIWHGAVT